MTLELQIATTAEAPLVAALVNSAYRGQSSRRGWTTEADLLDGQRTDSDAIREVVSDDKKVILLFRQNNAVTACVYLENRVDYAYLGMLTVSPCSQAAGLGKQVLAKAEAWVKAHWKVQRVRLTVIKQRQELIAWYERRGYQSTGEVEPFPINDQRCGIPKVSGLAFNVYEKSL